MEFEILRILRENSVYHKEDDRLNINEDKYIKVAEEILEAYAHKSGATVVKWRRVEDELPNYGWFIVAYKTNDKNPTLAVTLLWYNSDAIHKWWIGTSGKCLQFEQPVKYWMPLPKPPSI